jgi:hypothetical protein
MQRPAFSLNITSSGNNQSITHQKHMYLWSEELFYFLERYGGEFMLVKTDNNILST